MARTFALYTLKPRDGAIEGRLSARFELDNGSVRVLEDHYRHLQDVQDGPLTRRTQAILDSFGRAAYYEVIEGVTGRRNRSADAAAVCSVERSRVGRGLLSERPRWARFTGTTESQRKNPGQ